MIHSLIFNTHTIKLVGFHIGQKKKDLTLTWTFLPNSPYLVLHLQVSPAAVRTASSPCAPPTGGPIPAPAWPAAWASRTTSLSSACVASATRAPANPARGTKGRTGWSHVVQEKLCGLRPFPCLPSPDALWSEWQPGCCCRWRWFWRCEGPEQWGTVVVGFFFSLGSSATLQGFLLAFAY